MPTIDSLHELLKHELKDLYSAETQIIKALPGMIEASSNSELKKGLQQHLSVTKEQKKRLEKVQEILGVENAIPEKRGFFANIFKSDEGEEHCKAMEGLVKEGDSLLKEDMTPEVKDAAIIAAAQKIEHYEISSYGTARAFARQLNLNDVAKLLEQTLEEEYFADDSLSKLALSKINLSAESDLKPMPKKQKTGSKIEAITAKKASTKSAKKAKGKTIKKSSTKAKK